ncbi:MAG: tryptophan synthase subunit alpha [Dermatophilaceae bacterium]
MTRVEEALARAKDENRAALIAYLPVGFPDVPRSLEAMQAVVEAGADIVEVGFPYSDPMMDGPIIQDAASRALAAGVRMDDAFTAVRAVVAAGGAATVMSYWNPIMRRGVDRFARDLAAAGGSGVITPDLIPDEGEEWEAAAAAHDICPIYLVAPSSKDDRLAMTAGHCRGFVYVASLMGVTGTRASVSSAAEVLVGRTRAVTRLPLCVGLGVSTREQAASVSAYADGVIVGSALVKTLLGERPWDARIESLRALTRDLAAGVREGRG